MKIERLILENFRGIGKTLELPLEPDLTVLAGVNGSGKSSILDALAILLSWVVARVRRAGGSGFDIPMNSIHNSYGYARIRAEAINKSPMRWQLVRGKKGHSRPPYNTELGDISGYIQILKSIISEENNDYRIPIFAYYPINRAVLKIDLRIRQPNEFSLLDSWHESLTGSTNFNRFFEWFRNREDLENEAYRYHSNAPDSQLESVRRAMQIFLPGFKGLSVRRSPLRMTVNKNGKEIRVDQLSDGERCLIALVGDLARRLAIANPNMANPLKGEGIVLIDEIDLHIHPGWQRTILTNLRETFPDCQFVVSTHSPQVLGEAEGRQIRLLAQDEENGFSYSVPAQAKGLSSNEILDELMRPDGKTLARDSKVQQQLDRLFELIDQDKFQDAKTLIADMKRQLHGDIPDLVRAESLLFMLDADGEQ